MKYLITGGLGFIGTKIIEKLSNDGHSVVCVDNKDTYNITCFDWILYCFKHLQKKKNFFGYFFKQI